MNTAIEISNLNIGYRSKKKVKTVAAGINAKIFGGELTCLLGINGIGKSTLLRTLAGFQPALSGEIRLLGRDVSSFSHNELARTIGIVLTDRVNVRDMTVTELIALGRSPYTNFWGKTTKKDRNIVQQALNQMNINHLADSAIHAISDGERQKVMIAKALAQETPIILLDEPTAFLDYPSKNEILLLLRQLSREKGKAIFVSTHDLELTLHLADRLWIMDKTQGVTVGTPEELVNDKSIEKIFVTALPLPTR